MRLQQDSNFTTLSWVKPELDETLRLARQALETHVENGAERGQMQVCVAQLHQVQGTLRMVELYGAAMVAEEMEQLANALLGTSVTNREEAYGALMRSIMQLPDYLERLQSGHKDIPMVLLPLLNDLRGARGEKVVPESVLFSVDLTRPLPASADSQRASLPESQLRIEVGSLREGFQSVLLPWLRDEEQPANIATLREVCTRLVETLNVEPARKLFWIAAGILDALHSRAFVASKPLKQALAKLEREIKRLADDGEAAYLAAPPTELTRQLLYYVANAPTDDERIVAIRETFGLDREQLNEAELAHARGSLTGHNRELLDTVSAGIKEDLLRVKEALDMHLRTSGAPVAELAPQAEALGAIADTLGMLGLGIPRKVVQDQRTAIQALATGKRVADESALLEIAGSLLYVEASLDDQVARLGQAPEHAQDAAAMPLRESQQALEALIKESVSNFVQARQCFVAFIEAGWDHAQLHDVPRLLDEVSGAMHLLEQQRAARQLHALSVFTQIELVQLQRVPDAFQMDRLADALASLEYYLEALRDHRPQRDRILELAEHGLVALGYWPVPAAADQTIAAATRPKAAPVVAAAPAQPTPVAVEATPAAEVANATAPAAEVAATVEDATETIETAETEVEESAPAESEPVVAASATPAPVAAPASPGINYGFAANAEIDDDIREVFIEELDEEAGNLNQLFAEWSAAPTETDVLRPLRRVFHTLKGSGRLVGALELGEFSWHIESMLNRVLDGSRPASSAVVALVGLAAETLPQFRSALMGAGTVTADIGGLTVYADRVAAGEEVFYEPAPIAAVVVEPVVVAVEPIEALPVAAPIQEAKPVEAVEIAAPAEEAIPEGEYASVDPVLLEILRAEVDAHLQTILLWSATNAGSAQKATDSLLRAVHTISGAFAMTEVPLITDVLSPTEGYIRRLLAQRELPSAAGVALIGDVARAIEGVLAALQQPRPLIARQDALADRAVALRDALPEPTTPTLPVHLEEAEEEQAEAERVEAERAAAEQAEAARAEAERTEAERVAAEHKEAERVAAEHQEAERVAAEQAQAERVAAEQAEAERIEAEHIAAEQAEAERIETERLAAEQAEAERIEAERIAAEQAEAERIEAERIAAEQAEAERAAAEQEAERVAAEQAEAERIEAARLAAEQSEAERIETERVAGEQAEAERVEAERIAAEQTEAERVEAERIAAERAEAERVEAERVAADQSEAERLESERVAADQAEAERVAAEQAEADRVEAERFAAEQAEAERLEYEKLEAEYAEADRLAAGQSAAAESTEAQQVEAEPVAETQIEAEPVVAEAVAEQPALAEHIEAENVATENADAEHLAAEQEAERIAAALAEAERMAAEHAEAQRLAADQEADRVAAEEAEAERVGAQQVEAERVAAEQEAERVAAEHAEAERLEYERLEAEIAELERHAAEQRADSERVAAEHAEAERVATEQEAERVATEQEAERVAAEQAEAERAAAESAAAEQEAECVAAEQAEAERAAAEQEAERVAAEQAEAERAAAEHEAERVAAEQAEAERAAAEHEAERVAAEHAEAERAAAEQVAERIAAEQAEAERAAAEQDAERVAAEQAEAERIAAEQEIERAAAEQAEADRIAVEKELIRSLALEQADSVRIARTNLEVARATAEQAEADRIAADKRRAGKAAKKTAAQHVANAKAAVERAEAELAEAERITAERIAAEQEEAERLAAERMAAERAETEALGAEVAQAAQDAVVEPSVMEEATNEELIATETAAEQTEEPSFAFIPEGVDADPDEALDLSDVDPELLDIFIEETTDILDHSDGLLTRLRKAPSEREPVVGLQRDLHTLKGGARMCGMMSMGELAHAMESVLESAAEVRMELGAQGLGILEQGFDRLHGMLSRIQHRQAVALPEHLIAVFNALAKGEVTPVRRVTPAAPVPAAEVAAAVEDIAATARESAAPAEQPEEVAEVADSVQPTRSKQAFKPLSVPVEAAFDDDDDIGVRAPQEQVRIRADLLDRLVNYAGEVAIYRARLEQQLGTFRTHLDELEQTTMRLRSQLRKLEIETEAQISARYQRAGDGEEAFDPLELDRFSTQQQLTRALAESAADMTSLHVSLDDVTRQYETLLLQQSRVSSELQDGLMRTRMVPFDALVPRLRRVVRQTATETGKQIQLKVEGAQGEMDRNVLDRMTAPLEHMLRNAAVHGLESPQARRDAGKNEEGTVTVSVHREGSEVVMLVSDDGRGLDRDAIRRKAIDRGLLKPDAEIGDNTLYAFILESGFSTADNVSRLAGRGVGMDVVHNEIRQLGGSLQLSSIAGKGSQFTIRLPFTLAVTQAALVKIGETSFAVPISSVQGVGRIARAELEKQLASENPVYVYAGEDYAIHDLGRLLGGAPAKAQGSLQMPLLLSRSGDVRAAICVDEVLGSREIVVKPVGPQVSSIPGIFGATIMGDGGVMVILDVVPLVRRVAAQVKIEERVAEPEQEVRRVPLVMVVDDSITMRKVTGRVLERNNMEVLAAKDGVDAIEKMVDLVPDLMLLDIEMPRMDGYELATHMRNDPRLRDVPIVMITSRTGEKHRQRAFEIGVNRYLGKPYQEAELMRNVFELLAPVHNDG
jgi:chemotaxis protein histidine kinase CheA